MTCQLTTVTRCSNCARACPKDKAVSRFIIRNFIDSSTVRDICHASIYTCYLIPKLHVKLHYCISCAIHSRIARNRPKEGRKVRTPPLTYRMMRELKEEEKKKREEKKRAKLYPNDEAQHAMMVAMFEREMLEKAECAEYRAKHGMSW